MPVHAGEDGASSRHRPARNIYPPKSPVHLHTAGIFQSRSEYSRKWLRITSDQARMGCGIRQSGQDNIRHGGRQCG